MHRLRTMILDYPAIANESEDLKRPIESITQEKLEMAVHLRFLTFMQYLFAILIVLYIGSYAYQQYYLPNFLHVVDINKIEILPPFKVPVGGVIRYTVDVDKFYNIRPVVHRELHGEDGLTKVVISPDLSGTIGTGHFVSRRDIVVPPNTPPMRYRIHQVFEYPVGWGRVKSYEMASENWVEVTNGEPNR